GSSSFSTRSRASSLPWERCRSTAFSLPACSASSRSSCSRRSFASGESASVATAANLSPHPKGCRLDPRSGGLGLGLRRLNYVRGTAARSLTMRRTTDRPSRLPAPRTVLVPRSRLAPLAVALPLVLGLWLTIGLPILAEVSGTTGGGGPMRDFLFGAAATGGSPGSGGDRRGPSGAGTVAAAVVDPRIVREVRL